MTRTVIPLSFRLIEMSLVSELIAHRKEANRLVETGDLDSAVSVANDILRTIDLPEFPEFFRTRGNGSYCAYSILGMAAINDGDSATAAELLLSAGKTPPSPARQTFGPNMILPQMLLDCGEVDAVLQFLDCCRETWYLGLPEIERWSIQISAGEQPDFGANLDYSL